MKILEISEEWALIYHDSYIGWMPYCRIHGSPQRPSIIKITDYCGCEVPREVWKKIVFMDKLEKFK